MVIPNIGGKNSAYTILTLINGGIKPDLVVVGSDWCEKDYLSQMGFTWEWLGKKDIGLCYVKYTSGVSTTELKKRLSASDSNNHNPR